MSFKNISVQEFKGLMDKDDYITLDVRTPQEKVEGEIPNALLINLMGNDFPEKVDELDQSKSYLVFCRSGGRSVTACKFMASRGFTNLFNLVGGIQAWNNHKS